MPHCEDDDEYNTCEYCGEELDEHVEHECLDDGEDYEQTEG